MSYKIDTIVSGFTSYPATTLIRSTNCIQHELHAITVRKCRRVFDGRASRAQRFADGHGERRKTSGPTAFAHALGHVVLIDLHRTPRTRSGRREPQLASLLNHQRAFGPITLKPVFVLA